MHGQYHFLLGLLNERYWLLPSPRASLLSEEIEPFTCESSIHSVHGFEVTLHDARYQMFSEALHDSTRYLPVTIINLLPEKVDHEPGLWPQALSHESGHSQWMTYDRSTETATLWVVVRSPLMDELSAQDCHMHSVGQWWRFTGDQLVGAIDFDTALDRTLACEQLRLLLTLR